MPRKNNKKPVHEKKVKVQERGKKKPTPKAEASGPVATTEGEFLEARRKEFFTYLAEQDVSKIKAMIDREFKAMRRLEKVKNKRFDPFKVFKYSGLGSVPFDIVPLHVNIASGGTSERRGGKGKQQAGAQAPPSPQFRAVPSVAGACDYTPLHLAVIQKDLQAVKQLTKDLNANHLVIDKTFRAPLYYALQSGNRDLIRYMSECRNASTTLKDLQCGNPNYIENWNETFVAAFYGDSSVFVDSMGEPTMFSPHLVDKAGRSLFHVLAMHDDKSYVSMLRTLARKCPDETGNVIEELEKDEEPVPQETGSTHPNEGHADGEKEAEDDSWKAYQDDGEEGVEETEEDEASEEQPEEKEEAPLREPEAKLLRKVHINWNARAFKGGLPLHVAVYECNPAMTEIMLKEGANVNRPNAYDGKSALHYAVERNNPALLSMLLDYAADKTATDGEGRTPLQLAQHLGFAKMVDLLDNYQPVSKPKEAPRGRGSRAPRDSVPEETQVVEKDIEQGPFVNLPTQLWVQVARYLALDEVLELGHVCRRLRHIAKADALWADINLNDYALRFPTVERFKKFTYYHLYKTSRLVIDGLNLHPRFILQEVLFGNGKLAQKLESFKLNTRAVPAEGEQEEWKFDIKYLNQLLDCCPHLLSLECTAFSPESEDNSSVNEEALKRLKRFSFEVDKDSKQLLPFVKQFEGSALEELKISFNTRVARANEILAFLGTSSLTSSLRRLTICSSAPLSDNALQALSSLSHLERLVLCVKNVSPFTLQEIAKGAGQHLGVLKVATSEPSPASTDEGASFLETLQALPSLQSLSLTGGIFPDGEVVKALIETKAIPLHRLELSNFDKITDHHIETLGQSCLIDTLFSLRLESVGAITKDGIGILMSRFRNLRSLVVRNCKEAKIATFTDLLQLPLAKVIRTLELQVDGEMLKDTELTTLLMNCPSLSHLGLYGVTVADDWFRPSFYCPQLRTLILQGDAQNMGDYGLSRLAYQCPSLKRLELIAPSHRLSRCSVHYLERCWPLMDVLRLANGHVLYGAFTKASPIPVKKRMQLLSSN